MAADSTIDSRIDNERDLVITRVLRAPRARVWKAWTDPQVLQQWWCPKPWTTEVRAFDLRPGGAFHTTMKGPEGESSDNPGSFIEIVPQSRIVWTTALLAGWRPAADHWMPLTAIISFEDEGDDTRYTAVVMHKDKASRDEHDKMGFFDGWGACIAQLEAVAAAL